MLLKAVKALLLGLLVVGPEDAEDAASLMLVEAVAVDLDDATGAAAVALAVLLEPSNGMVRVALSLIMTGLAA